MNLFIQKHYFKLTRQGWGIISRNYKKLFKYGQSLTSYIPYDAIKEILDKPELYEYCLKCIGRNNTSLEFIAIQNTQNTRLIFNYEKDIVISSLNNFPKDELTQTQLKRLENLISTATPEYFFKNMFNNIVYQDITIKDIFKLLIMPQSDFMATIESNPFNISIAQLVKILTDEPFNLKYKNKNNFQNNTYILTLPFKKTIPFYQSYGLKEGYGIQKNFDALYKKKAQTEEYLDGVTQNQVINYFSQNGLTFDARETLGIDNERLAETLKKSELIADLTETCIRNITRFIYAFEADNVPTAKLEKPPLPYIKDAKLNDIFKNRILEEIPMHFTNAQKIYYIYRRVCEKLSYDEEYYSGNQKQMFTINHLDLKRIEEINDENNLVICWESTLILAKFCECLNIPYVIESKHGLNYGDGHTSLHIFCDGFVFAADSAADLAVEKTHNRVNMFYTENTAERKKEEFEKLKKEVDDFIDENKINIKFLNAKEVFENIYSDDCPEISTEERFNIFLSVFDKINLNTLDAIEYIVSISKKIRNDENTGFWGIEFVANNRPINLNKQISLVSLIYYSPTYQIDHNENNFVYYIVEEKIKRGPYTKKYIEELFRTKQLATIRQQGIPGIMLEKEAKNTNDKNRTFKRS